MKSVSGMIFLVKDLGETVSFYERLGFEFTKQTPGISATAYVNGFWIEFLLQDKVITEAFQEDIAFSPKGTGSYIHIQVDSVDDYYASLVDKGITPLGEPADFPWGHREFVVRDPTGYKLVFFCTI